MHHQPISMPCFTRLQESGLGLIDVLIALLLLSLALLSAGVATLSAMQAGRSATLQMRAADLGADLHEDLEAAQGSNISVQIAEWRQRVAATLPAAVATIDSAASSLGAVVLTAHLHWKEPADAALDLSMPRPQQAGEVDP